MLATLFCCARAVGAPGWQGRPYAVVMSHIQGVGQPSTGSTQLTLQHDATCTVSVSVNTPGDEVLTVRGSGGGGPTLTTSYKITGIADYDANWLSSSAFLTRWYTLNGNATDTLMLSVQGTGPANSAPEAGAYTAMIVLTVTF
jgi:spore coat protein U-like protein